MTKSIKAVAAASLILGIISLIWILYDLFLISADLQGVLFGSRGTAVGIGYIVILLLHGMAFLLILLLFSRFRGYGVLKAISIAAVVNSLLMLAVQKVMYDEVGREIKFGSDAGEIVFVNLGLVINASFCFLVIGLAVFAFRKPHAGTDLDKGGPIFTLAQFMGIVSGLLGLFLTFSLVGRQVPAGRLWFYVPFYLLFLFPYGLTALFWLAGKRQERLQDWYDEKQWQDLALAALATLVLSIPALTLFLFVPDGTGVYWYPYYLFTVLLLFSASTLYFYKRS